VVGHDTAGTKISSPTFKFRGEMPEQRADIASRLAELPELDITAYLEPTEEANFFSNSNVILPIVQLPDFITSMAACSSKPFQLEQANRYFDIYSPIYNYIRELLIDIEVLLAHDKH
jgi:hypothetical protein